MFDHYFHDIILFYITMASETDQEETFTQEAERLAQERIAALTAEDEDAELKLALATLMKVAERPPRAPRGINDVWGWSVGNEHALQPGTESRQQVIERIRRSYTAEPKTGGSRNENEKGALETIASALENIKDNPGFASHDLKRIVKALDTIISDRIGPGDDPSGKPSKYLLLPGSKTAAQIAMETAAPVPEPTAGSKDYVHARSNVDPNFIELEQRHGKTQVYIELQRIKLGMMPLNEDIAKAIAEIAEKVDSEAKQALRDTKAERQYSPEPHSGGTTQLHGDNSDTDISHHTANDEQTGAKTVLTDEAQAGIAELGTPEIRTTTSPSKAFIPKRSNDFTRDNEFEDTSLGLRIKCRMKGLASIKTKNFSFDYSFKELVYAYGFLERPKGIIEIAEAENSRYYPFTIDYIKFISEANRLYDEKKALSSVRVEADKQGPLSRMRLRWKDHAEGAPYRMAGWEFYRWSKQMTREIHRMQGKPDWDRLEELKNWNDWGKEPADVEPHGPA